MSQLNGKVALVTGGGRGIGRAIAMTLSDAGASVAVTGRNITNLEDTKSAIIAKGGKALALACDVSNKSSVESAFEKIRAELGAVDILVNNAGVTYSRKFHETPDDVWEQIIQTNVNGVFYCCKAALPDMIQKRWGRIVTIASIAGLSGIPFSSAYGASKHAQVGLTRSLALEVARYNIAVNAICPGWVETDMLEESIANIVKITGRTADEARAELLKLGGQARAVAPEEVANEALRLASLEDAKTTGQAIPLL